MVEDVRHQAPLGKSHHQSLLLDLQCYTDKKQNTTKHFNFAKGDYVELRSEIVAKKKIEQKIKDMNVCQA